MNTSTLAELVAELNRDPAFVQEYARQKPEHDALFKEAQRISLMRQMGSFAFWDNPIDAEYDKL